MHNSQKAAFYTKITPSGKKKQKKLAENLPHWKIMPTFAVAKSGFSAVGSAHVWGARGRWFESSNPDRGGKKLIFNDLPLFYVHIIGVLEGF